MFLNRVFGKVERSFTSRWFNPFATLYLNLRTMPLGKAIHFPIYVYGRIRFTSLKEKIVFSCPLKSGLVKIGRHDDGYKECVYSQLFLSENAAIIICGY